MEQVRIEINGQSVEAEVDERSLLIDFIRDEAGLTGTHGGCFEARCGSCTVLLDGKPVKSCNVLALQAEGAAVSTVEGLAPQTVRPIEHITTESLAQMYQPLSALGADPAALHPLQQAFHRHGALQCGFCTPGMLMVLAAFLESCPEPTEESIREAISGNLCRCTGYQSIVEAALAAAGDLQAPTAQPATDAP